MKKADGFQICAILYDCDCEDSLLTDAIKSKVIIEDIISGASLGIEGSLFKQFETVSSEQSGFTGAVVISESHVCIHTWPEKENNRRVDIDIYVCHVLNDNEEKARDVYNKLIDLYKPKEIDLHIIHRGKKEL